MSNQLSTAKTYNSPWTIQEVRDNGTIKISTVLVSDVYNIWNIIPYIQQSWIMGKCAINGIINNYKIAKFAYIQNNAWLISI